MTEGAVILCTGGIGSGKSFAVRIFNALGVPSYDCDGRVKELYDEDPVLASEVDSAAGGGLISGGRLDRKRLASVIFSKREILENVEALVHPALVADFTRWRAAHKGPVVMESAILLEKPAIASIPDIVVSVTAPLETRLQRVMSRDSATREDVLRRIANQTDDRCRAEASDFVVINDGKAALLPQILDIMDKINKFEGYGKDRS